MGATFSRLKNWIAEVLTYADLNAEIDNILNNLGPAGVDDYSINVIQMQTTTDPGESASESLATSLAGEIERLRFAIGEIKGTSLWYTTADATLNELNGLLANDTPRNRIASGQTKSSTDTQPTFLVPNGAAASLVVDADTTDLVYFIEGTSYTVDEDVTISSLLTAPASNNTCLVNEPSYTSDEEATRTLGEYGTQINIDNIGAEITTLNGKLAAFSITNGVDTEYFLARVDTTNSRLYDCRRGYFFNSSTNPVKRIVFSDNDTITLLKLTWVYANTSGGFIVNYNNPVYSGDEPSGPATGDYWFDLTNKKWKTFDSAVWQDASVILVGTAVQDTSNCIGARAEDFFKNQSSRDTMDFEIFSATTINNASTRAQVAVNGTILKFEYGRATWDITTDLESGVSEGASTTYYLYLDMFGDEIISDIKPYDRTKDLLGYYHPHHPWRCVGVAYNDSSSALTFVRTANDVLGRSEALLPIGSLGAAPPAGTIISFHSYNGLLSPGQGWMLCDGRIVNESNYDTEFSSGDWALYIGNSDLDGLYLPDLTGSKYLTGVADTTEDGSGAIAEVGNASNQVDLQHSHTVNSHNHQWFDDDGSGTDNSFNSSGSSINIPITGGAGDTTIVGRVTDATAGVSKLNADLYTDNQSPGTNNQLSTTQSIQPRSVEVLYYMRIA